MRQSIYLCVRRPCSGGVECWKCRMSLTGQKATKTKANELVKRKCMCKSLGRNNNDTVMGIHFIVYLAAVE